MRKILLFVLVGCFFSAKAQDIDVLHYRFELNLNDKSDSIFGKALIKMILKEKVAAIPFDLQNIEINNKGMTITKVVLNEPKGLLQDQIILDENFNEKRKWEHLHEGNNVLIPVFNYKKGDTALVTVIYKGVPADGLIISKNKYGERTFFADNWPNRAHHWIPCVDRPDDKASFEFIVTAPSHYKVISNGIKVEEKETGNGFKLTHWKETIPSSTKVMVIGVAKFATKTYDDSPKDIPVSAWTYPRDSAKWFYDYALTPGILKFFADYIGPFPYKKLANVQSKTVFGGMENASAIFYNENYVTGSRAYEDVMAHEIAHQWFGDMVSEKSFAHLWLSEGFADFFESLYIEKKYGEKAAREKWLAARDEAIAFARQSNKPVVDSSEDLMSLLNANSYKKGAWVLRMLRNEVGDSVFKKIIQTYYSQYKGSNAETRDFEVVAEKVSGKELTWFFDQWLYQAEIPKVLITYLKSTEGVRIRIAQLQKQPFQFALPVAIEFNGRKEKKIVRVTKADELFLIAQDRDKITIDPDCTMLFEEVKKQSR